MTRIGGKKQEAKGGSKMQDRSVTVYRLPAGRVTAVWLTSRRYLLYWSLIVTDQRNREGVAVFPCARHCRSPQ
jgi:hypothetical protein